MLPMPAKKKKRSFGKGGKKATINNPDTHHGTYDLPNASVRSYSEKAKPMKFAKGGSTTFAEEFKKARDKGAGTVFDWKGQKIAAYRKGEEPKSWNKGKGESKKEAPKPAPKAEPKQESKATPPRPTTQADTNRNQAAAALESARMIGRKNEDAAMTPEQRMNRNQADAALASARIIKPKDMDAAKQFSRLAAQGGPMAEYYEKQAKKFAGETFAKGGTVESKKMMNMGGMAGYKKGGMACGGMKKYARGGGIESHGKTKGSMVRMASGGSVSARADGIASKGKTNCKIC